MARVLIVGDSTRSMELAGELLAGGHAVRVVTEAQERRAAIESLGAECWIGTPQRLASMRGALEHVTIACWLLGDIDEKALGRELVGDLHGSRLERFLCDAIDTTLRGFVYELPGDTIDPEVAQTGRRVVSETAARNSIPVESIEVDPKDAEAWLERVREALGALLGEPVGTGAERYAQ